MTKIHPYVAYIQTPSATSFESDEQLYSDVMQVACDIEIFPKGDNEPYLYTYKVWWWYNSTIFYNGQYMTWIEYLDNEFAVPIKEGMYITANVQGKDISGEIKLFNPSQLGVMLGVDKNPK